MRITVAGQRRSFTGFAFTPSHPGGRAPVLLSIFIVFEILTNESFNGTVYYIVGGIVAWDEAGFPIRNNTPPETPEVNGPARGKKGVNITFGFVTNDSERDYIYYSIGWGDNTTDEIGPYPSNEEISINHIWYEKGGYVIKCKATDTYDAESEWNEYLFWVGRRGTAYMSLFQLLIERFPLLREVFARLINL